MINLDAELTTTVNDLLRSEPRLLAAAPLVGKVAVLYRDPKPEPETAPVSTSDKKPPPRVDGSAPDRGCVSTPDGDCIATGPCMHSGEVTEKPPGPAAIPSPWHGVVVISKADGLAKFPPDFFPEVPEDLRLEESGALTPDAALAEMNGGPILAKVTIDGTLWERLDGAGQRAALVAALRGLRHKIRASDDADLAVIEKPPIRTWPDTVDEAAEVMVQLGPDGAEGAALVGALALGGLGDALGEAVAAFKRRLDAGQDMRSWYSDLADLQADLDAVVVRVAAQVDPASHTPVGQEIKFGRHGDVAFLSEDDGEVLWHSIGWLHGGGPPGNGAHGAGERSQYKSRADWSARGWGLYSSGDLNDGHESIAELLHKFEDGVYLTMADFKAGRSVTIESMIDAARGFVGLPPLAEDPEAVGPSEDDGEEA